MFLIVIDLSSKQFAQAVRARRRHLLSDHEAGAELVEDTMALLEERVAINVGVCEWARATRAHRD